MPISTVMTGQGKISSDIVAALNAADTPSAINPFATNADVVNSSFLTVISPSILNADTHNWNPTDLNTATVIRASSSVNIALTGLAAVSGRTLLFHNIGSYDIQLISESASSTAANRFALSRNLRLFPNSHALLWYDGTSARWRVAGHSGAMAGDVLQVVTTVKTDPSFSSNSTSLVDITGLAVTITPRSSTSTIRVMASVCGGTPSPMGWGMALYRDETAIGVGDANSNRLRISSEVTISNSDHTSVCSAIAVDSPNDILAHVYKVKVATPSGSFVLYLNRNASYTDSAGIQHATRASAITVEEICQ